ncbi:hypothetical protein ACGFMM_18525 [Streptomyces sp. NPDC048604]|uniref:Rv1733c family protein n=1 Tax=Streptomyces sp. NPDC048604 TaxID=3365578 RepID=UPI003721A1D3
MGAFTGLWRWRHNSLRRTTDLVEAWVACVAFLLLVLGAPATGLWAGLRADDGLQHAARAQQAERRPVTARVVRVAEPSGQALQSPDAADEQRLRTAVVARWPAPDGSPRSGTVHSLDRDPEPGETFRIWTDAEGRAVPAPMRAGTARAHALFAGLFAASAVAVAAETARRTVVRGLIRRRYAELDLEWAGTGPDWGRAGTGC